MIPEYCAEQVKIGVLAFRPKPQTLAQWEPLATALKQTMLASLNVEDGVDPRHLCMIEDITKRKKAENEREVALARINSLEGIIPICSYCKKIRDDQQNWHQVEK